MTLKLNLLKIVPLVTTTVGVLVPGMASAAVNTEPARVTEIDKHSVIIEAAAPSSKATVDKTAGDRGTSTGEHKEVHEATTKSKATVDKITGEHGATTDYHGGEHGEVHGATADDHGGDHGASGRETLLSPKAQQIEFFTFLGAIGLAVIVPELLYRPKKIAQNFLQLENSVREFPQDASSKLEDTQQHKSKTNSSPAEADTPQVQLVEFGQTTPEEIEEQTVGIGQNNIREFPQDAFSKLEDTQEHKSKTNSSPAEADTPQVQLVEFSRVTPEEIEEQTASISRETTEIEEAARISEDIPNIKIIPSDIQPYTIPNKRLNQFDIDGQIEVDNWSQPNRRAA